MWPLLADAVAAVFGSRVAARGERHTSYHWQSVINRRLTWMARVESDFNPADVEICYKAFRAPLRKRVQMRSVSDGIESGITIKLTREKADSYEVPPSCCGSTNDEGRRIGLREVCEAMWSISRFPLVEDICSHSAGHMVDAEGEACRFNRRMVVIVRPGIDARGLEVGSVTDRLASQLVCHRQLSMGGDLDPEHLARLGARCQRRPACRCGCAT